MDLRKLVGGQYVVSMDESWRVETPKNRMEFRANGEEWRYQEIRGQLGVIYPYSESQIAVSLVPRAGRRLAAVLGSDVTCIQRCDEAICVKTDVRNLALALKYVKAKRRRHLTAEQKAARLIRLAPYSFGKEFLPQPEGTFTEKEAPIPMEAAL